MTFSVIKNGSAVVSYSTAEQCAAEILVRGWAVVEKHGLWFVQGVEIRDDDKTVNDARTGILTDAR